MATLTGNGSNMIAAFCPQVSEGNNDDCNDDYNDEVMESGEDSDQPTISSLVLDFKEREVDHEIAKSSKLVCIYTLQF